MGWSPIQIWRSYQKDEPTLPQRVLRTGLTARGRLPNDSGAAAGLLATQRDYRNHADCGPDIRPTADVLQSPFGLAALQQFDACSVGCDARQAFVLPQEPGDAAPRGGDLAQHLPAPRQAPSPHSLPQGGVLLIERERGQPSREHAVQKIEEPGLSGNEARLGLLPLGGAGSGVKIVNWGNSIPRSRTLRFRWSKFSLAQSWNTSTPPHIRTPSP